MKRFQSLLLVFMTVVLVIGSFGNKLNAQVQDTKSANHQNLLDTLAIIGFWATILSGILSAIGLTGYTFKPYIQRTFWRFRPDSSDVFDSRELLRSTIYYDSDLTKRNLNKKIDNKIKFYLKVKDKDKANLTIIEISRIFIMVN